MLRQFWGSLGAHTTGNFSPMQNKEMEWEILGSRDSLTSNHSMGVLPSLPANIYQVSVLGLSGTP